MQTSLRTLLISAVAILSCAACLPAAAAHDGQTRVMELQLPDGSIERISYTGDVAPRIMVLPADAPSMMPMPAMMPVPAIDPGFAAVDRLFAALDRQADAMLRDAAQWPRLAAAGAALPPGTSGYAVVTTFSSNGACTRSTQVHYAGDGVAPRAVSSTSGDCGAQHLAVPSTARPMPREELPYGGLVTPAMWVK